MKSLGILEMRESSCFRGKIKSTTKFYLLKLYRDLGNATSHGNWVRILKRSSKKKPVNQEKGCVCIRPLMHNWKC